MQEEIFTLQRPGKYKRQHNFVADQVTGCPFVLGFLRAQKTLPQDDKQSIRAGEATAERQTSIWDPADAAIGGGPVRD